MNQELIATISSNGYLELEWKESDEQINNDQQILQKELYDQY
jgi:hypothetical protein